MATTTDTYDGTGSQTDFTITFPYTAIAFVTVYVDSVLQTLTTHYSFLSPTSIRFVTPPPLDTGNVEFIRVTSTTPLVDWVNGATVLESNLDLADNQMLHVMEELENTSITSMGKDGANWDADSNRIVNVSPPIADTDVATKASIAAQVTAAETAETNAETAETNAETAETNAATSETNAGTSETNAAASAASIAAVYPVSGMTAGYTMVVNDATSVVEERREAWIFVETVPLSGLGSKAVGIEFAGTNEVKLVLRNVSSTTDGAHLYLTFSDDDEVSYFAGTDYSYSMQQAGHIHNITFSTGAAQIQVAESAFNGSDLPLDMDIIITPGGVQANGRCRWTGNFAWTSNEVATVVHGAGHVKGAPDDLTHAKLAFSAGNFGTYTSGMSVYKRST